MVIDLEDARRRRAEQVPGEPEEVARWNAVVAINRTRYALILLLAALLVAITVIGPMLFVCASTLGAAALPDPWVLL